MAISNSTGFSPRSGAALPTDLGQALSVQLARLAARFRGKSPLPMPTGFSGPSFQQLTPSLTNETGRR